MSSIPSPIVAIQPLHELGEYFLRTSRQYFLRFTSSEMPLHLLSTVLDPRPPIFAHNFYASYTFYMNIKVKYIFFLFISFLSIWQTKQRKKKYIILFSFLLLSLFINICRRIDFFFFILFFFFG